MKVMINCWVLFSVMGIAMSAGAVLPVSDDFQGYGVGLDFTTSTNHWSSDSNVVVTNGVNRFADAAATNSVSFSGRAGLTNGVNSNIVAAVWTDFHIKPFKGDIQLAPPTNTASHIHYYSTAGYVVVATSNGWVTCSNDVWGMPVLPITSNWAHISVYQDYAKSNSALMINDQVVIQDLPFVGTAATYGKFIARNAQNSAWLDDVWIQTSYNPTLTANRNGDAGGLADAQELQLYGYAARTQYVGGTSGYPVYPTLQAALNAYRPRDILCVNGGTYNEGLTITQNVTVAGTAFTVSGSITVAAGAALTLNQNVTVSALNVFGRLIQSAGILACSSVTVGSAGLVTVAEGVTFNHSGVLSLTMGGRLDFQGATSRFISSVTGVDMTGPFVVTNNLADHATMGIPFADDFQKYALGSEVNALGFRGWDASAGVVVTNSGGLAGYTLGRTASQAVFLPDGAVISNRMVSAVDQKVWSDFYLVPHLGGEPVNAPTGTALFVSYVNRNGYLVVATPSGWVTCMQNYTNGPVPVIQENQFIRLTVCQDFSQRKISVFLNGVLLMVDQPFAAGGNTYSSFQVHNRGLAYLDDVRITSTLPDWMTVDLNNNGAPDALEVHLYGSLTYLIGTVYGIR